MPDVVADDEHLARFVAESNKRNQEGATWRAFVPPASGELSTARCGSDMVELKRLAIVYLGHHDTLGAAIFSAGSVRGCRLTPIASEPPDKHCNICGWPNDADSAVQKEKRKELAMKLRSTVLQWTPFG